MQRNGQNPIKAVNIFKSNAGNNQNTLLDNSKSDSCPFICPKCKVDVPPKPGFRVSSLRCPKCGSPVKKRK
jgi:hypothetical protein